jgi:hypothetical protein
MERKAALQQVCSGASCEVAHRPSSFPSSEDGPAPDVRRGETLILVLLVSLGLWAFIWGAVSLLGAYGLR